MTIEQQIGTRFARHLTATRAGRAYILSQAAEAEANGEGQVFERALARVEDPEVQRLIRRHQADEVRHASLFRERMHAQGVDPGPVPAELKIIDRLDRDLGYVLDRPLQTREDIMHMYLILQVIEERAVVQFRIIEPAFREVDPATADVIAEVARDEERHLKYCHAIAQRYAPDDRTRREALARYRRVEAKTFAAHSQANVAYAFAHGLLELSPLATLLWKGFFALARLRNVPLETEFARADESAQWAAAAA